MTTHPKALEYLINHITLPPELPSCSDSDFLAGHKALLDKVLQAARVFRSQIDTKYYETWSSIIRMLESYEVPHDSDSYNSSTLKANLNSLAFVDTPLLLYPEPQNAALFVKKDMEHYYIEASEVSPPASDVLACDRFIWQFPGRAVKVAATTFEDPILFNSSKKPAWRTSKTFRPFQRRPDRKPMKVAILVIQHLLAMF